MTAAERGGSLWYEFYAQVDGPTSMLILTVLTRLHDSSKTQRDELERSLVGKVWRKLEEKNQGTYDYISLYAV